MASNAGPPAAPPQFMPTQLNALFGQLLAQNLNCVVQTMRRVIHRQLSLLRRRTT
ncbi:hypothetical protein N657DRAFT_245765 [Parathielavia appendiculata]|uniref:Uncharacterized protein n=1 Tax=Parathielavia appendiculata TaxID=2587402 RepID=A0AAN6TTC3_9PEZI|nr:hypothetical protein N657DRAFT_245765 [Parathielavia appendiculata]